MTRIGSIGSWHPVDVDGRGRIDPGGDWLLDWWVGADDRWHVPEVEPAVRQYLIDHAPVLETLVKIPGGDARHCAYGFRGTAFDGGDEYIVAEVTNQSAIPFGLAFVIRPSGRAAGNGAPVRPEVTIEPADGGSGRDQAQLVRIDGRLAVLVPRAPAHVVHGTSDPWAVLVFPVAHTTSLRVVLPLGSTAATMAFPASVPTAVQVANGWAAQADRAARFDVPDQRMAGALGVARRQVLLFPPTLELAPALDLLGFHDEAGQALADEAAYVSVALDRADDTGEFLLALAQHYRLTVDRELLDRSVPAIAASANAVAAPFFASRKRRLGKAASPVAADAVSADPTVALRAAEAAALLLDAAGEKRGAADARGLADHLRPLVASRPADAATEDTPPDSPLAAVVGLVQTLRGLIVDDATPNTLHLVPELPPTWYGQGVDIRDAPTAAGRLSFSVRWHGERPALLWELIPHAHLDQPVTISAPGLDAEWSSQELQGETLLARVEPPPPDPLVMGTERTGPLTSAEAPVSVWSIGPSGQLTIDADASLPDPGPSFS